MLQDGETLEGRGMFGFDEESGNLYHVWADSSQGKIFFSVGEYNEREKTVTFHTADAREIMRNGSSPSRPGIRPGQTRPTQPGSRPGQPTRPGTPGGEPGASLISQQSPSQGQGQSDEGPRVVLRILDDNEHVVEYYRTDSPGGNAVRTMVVTYSRN